MKLMIALILTVLTLPAHANIARFSQVTKQIFRGGQPDTRAEYDFLKSNGIKTIINLRNDGEYEKSIAQQYGFGFKWFPMSAYQAPSQQMVEAALTAMNDPALQPVFVHCLHGKDRTGMMIAIHRVVYQRWPQRAAYNEMISFGFNRAFAPLLYTFYKWTGNAMLADFLFRVRRSLNLPAAQAAAGN
ncbi:MAG: tyrosine-protein phosphatase [Bdellovibrionia bacterium]